ncbi:MAG: OmpA family protein [Pseudomonadota bacterium]
MNRIVGFSGARGTFLLATCLILCLTLSACANSEKSAKDSANATTTVAAPANAIAAAPAAPPVALPHDEAVLAATKLVFTNANLPAEQKFSLVIDPLLDGVTGVQSLATAAMEKRLVALIKADYPQVEVKPFNAANVAAQPLILVGTFTPINLQGKAEGEKDAYRICFSLADLKTAKIIGKARTFSKPEGFDSQPLPFFGDSPVWVNDKVIDGYIKMCQASKVGDAINDAYLAAITVSSAVDEAQRAYHAKKYKDALALYNAILKMPSGDQPRVQVGIYLSNLKLNRREDAMNAFAKLVRTGLDSQRLAVKFNFKPGTAGFAADAGINERWLKEIAKQSAQQTACIEVNGHSSRGNSETLNERISLQRAEFVKQRMGLEVKELKQRLTTQGFGSKKTMVGTGKDDLSDALDRRVEFKPTAC